MLYSIVTIGVDATDSLMFDPTDDLVWAPADIWDWEENTRCEIASLCWKVTWNNLIYRTTVPLAPTSDDKQLTTKKTWSTDTSTLVDDILS